MWATRPAPRTDHSKANDRRTAVEITCRMREICPDDPVLLDFRAVPA